MSHRPNKNFDSYEFTVEKMDYIPNQENPERIEMTVSTTVEVNGEKKDIEISPPAFTPDQISSGRWEKHVCRKIDDKVDEIKGETRHEIPDLEGETIENSGYDFTGPKNSERYSERD